MHEQTDPKIDLNKVKDRYNKITSIWDTNDRWHVYTTKFIKSFLHSIFNNFKTEKKLKILNAGSGGNNYDIIDHEQFHIDIAESKLRGIPNSMISNIEKIDLEGNQFDSCICVGSVINYCDAIRAIQELFRLLKPGGLLILEFENSRSLEYLFSSTFNRNVAFVKTFYQSSTEEIWIYSENYILEILQVNGFTIMEKKRFHLLSPFIYFICKSPNIASIFVVLDPFIEILPFIGACSSNVILSCVKKV